jgi:hypothetical protein
VQKNSPPRAIKMEKKKYQNIIFLSQEEILGMDCDKVMRINLTQIKKVFYYFVGEGQKQHENLQN